MNIIQIIFLSLSVFLFSCTGEVGSSTTTNTSTTTTTASPTVSIVLKDASGKEVNEISLNTPGYIEVTAKNGDGTPVTNTLVKFSSTLGAFDPEAATAAMDANGVAKIVLNSTETAGSSAGLGGGEITATVNIGGTDYQAKKVFNVVSSLTTVSKGSLSILLTDQSGNDINNTISKTTPGKFTLTILDGSGNPVSGNVTVTTTKGSFSKTDSAVTSYTLATDANGKASVDIYSTEDQAKIADTTGGATFTATIETDAGTVSAQKNFSVQSIAPDISLVLTDASGQSSQEVSLESGATLEVSVKDNSATNYLSGAIVSLSTNLGSLSLTDTVSKGGVIKSTLTSTSAGVGTLTATIKYEGITVTKNLDFVIPSTNTANSATIRVQLEDASGNSVTSLSATTPASVVVILKDPAGQPLANTQVNLTTTLGALASTSAVSDSNGRVSVALASEEVSGSLAGVGKGTVTASAQYQGATLLATQKFTVLSDKNPAITIELQDTSGNVTKTVSLK